MRNGRGFCVHYSFNSSPNRIPWEIKLEILRSDDPLVCTYPYSVFLDYKTVLFHVVLAPPPPPFSNIGNSVITTIKEDLLLLFSCLFW